MKETLAAKRRKLTQKFTALWSRYRALEHNEVESITTISKCAADCPACPQAARLSASMRLLGDEIHEIERKILDPAPASRAGSKKRVSDVDILLALRNRDFKNDEQRARSVNLSASAFAKRKAQLPPEFAAIISG